MNSFGVTHTSRLKLTNVTGKIQMKGHLGDLNNAIIALMEICQLEIFTLEHLARCIGRHNHQNNRALHWICFPKPRLVTKKDRLYFDNCTRWCARNHMSPYQYCKTSR